MQLVKVVAIAARLPRRKWNKLVKEINSFCVSQGITIIRQRSDDHGNDRYMEFAFEIQKVKKVRKFINERSREKI